MLGCISRACGRILQKPNGDDGYYTNHYTKFTPITHQMVQKYKGLWGVGEWRNAEKQGYMHL